MSEPRLRVLSLGGGVQSTTLYLMAATGEISPPTDYAIFADTGWEPKAVYAHLEALEARGWPIPIRRVQKGNIREDVLRSIEGRRFATMPFHVRNPTGDSGLLRRQCTREYKVEPITREIRDLLGLRPRQRVQGYVEQWFGISLDEAIRMRDSRYPWIRNRYPLIERRMRRQDCVAWLERRGFPIPLKSSCVACPYHDNAAWKAMRDLRPDEWKEAVEFDEKIRRGLRGVECEAYVHRQLVPLSAARLEAKAEQQMDLVFGEECEGLCGV